MNDQIIKHLEIIQSIVSRMAQNSFAIKGLAVTIVAALLALNINSENAYYLLIAILSNLAFWGLDSYYLRLERMYRELYDDIRKMDIESYSLNPFTLNVKPYCKKVSSWFRLLFSRSEFGFYGSLLLIAIVIIIGINFL